MGKRKIGSFRIWTSEASDCAIVVPGALCYKIRSTVFGDRFFGVALGNLILVSCHLIWNGHIVETTLVDITWEILNIQLKYPDDEFGILIGVDANVSLNPGWTSLDAISETQINHTGDYTLTTKHSEADRSIFCNFLERSSLWHRILGIQGGA